MPLTMLLTSVLVFPGRERLLVVQKCTHVHAPKLLREEVTIEMAKRKHGTQTKPFPCSLDDVEQIELRDVLTMSSSAAASSQSEPTAMSAQEVCDKVTHMVFSPINLT